MSQDCNSFNNFPVCSELSFKLLQSAILMIADKDRPSFRMRKRQKLDKFCTYWMTVEVGLYIRHLPAPLTAPQFFLLYPLLNQPAPHKYSLQYLISAVLCVCHACCARDSLLLSETPEKDKNQYPPVLILACRVRLFTYSISLIDNPERYSTWSFKVFPHGLDSNFPMGMAY